MRAWRPWDFASRVALVSGFASGGRYRAARVLRNDLRLTQERRRLRGSAPRGYNGDGSVRRESVRTHAVPGGLPKRRAWARRNWGYGVWSTAAERSLRWLFVADKT